MEAHDNGPIIPQILPIGRSWFIALDATDNVIEAFDAETMARLFAGRLIAPDEFEGRDPRRWTDEQLQSLLHTYGLYGGTMHDGAIFVLAEVVALQVLMKSVRRGHRKEIDHLPLIEALAEARHAYEEFMCEQATRLRAAS
jgi:hypothetical protein